jgi:hypothetical protein
MILSFCISVLYAFFCVFVVRFQTYYPSNLSVKAKSEGISMCIHVFISSGEIRAPCHKSLNIFDVIVGCISDAKQNMKRITLVMQVIHLNSAFFWFSI